LGAINFEIVSAENVSAIRSGAVLLFVFIGGIGFFFGPLLGAVVGVFFSVMLSDFTPAWQLYLGLFFILVVRYAPAGLASLILLLLRVASFGQFGRIWKPLLALCAVSLLGLAGVVMAIEMLYHLTLEGANGSVMSLFGQQVDTKAVGPWLLGGALALAGLFGYRKIQPGYYAAWSDINADIAAKQRGSKA
jgi:branched-chain amino acid transport system permease protein